MSNPVKDNIFFNVDFDSRYIRKDKQIVQDVRFFVIGVLPIIITHLNGEEERAVLKTPLEVEQNPYLRMLHGARNKAVGKIELEVKDKFKIDVDFKKYTNQIVKKATEAIKRIDTEKEFMGKKIKEILIIKIK